MRNTYPSDISEEQFELIRLDLASVRKKTKPRKISLCEVFCAINYVLKSGCQWRMLPSDFPKWEIVYFYFQMWTKPLGDNQVSIFEKILKKLVGLTRTENGKKNDEFLHR